jgi:class 3 adenylate cyclase
VVIRNPCNEDFTYQINGRSAIYQGVGDRHATKYDKHESMSRLVDLKFFASRDSIYSGAPIDTDFCPYTLHVFPSDTLKADYVSQDATHFLVAVLLIFLFSSSVFFLYDWYVEKRQYRTKSEALRSSAIVSSLFPSTVRDHLYKSSKNILRRRSTRHFSTADLDKDHDQNIAEDDFASPIAQKYPHTTVLFADIVGFTNWCSTREPSQVFHLLETLFAGFDALAKVHGVFKVETIGDAYVAVVGLPKPRKRHAIIMAKFANDIRTKMMELTTELEQHLGPVRISTRIVCVQVKFLLLTEIGTIFFFIRQGTSNLSLRIGLNSGPTTAGVLRGEKARFQLFGDVSFANQNRHVV